MKFIFVRFRGLTAHNRLEFCLVLVPPELTVSEFKSLWGDGRETVVYSPTRLLPLHDEARLFDCVQEFDTVTIASSWISTLLGDDPLSR